MIVYYILYSYIFICISLQQFIWSTFQNAVERKKDTRERTENETCQVFVSKLQKNLIDRRLRCVTGGHVSFFLFSFLHRSCLTVILFPTGVSLKRQREKSFRFHFQGEKPLNSCWFFVPESRLTRRGDRRRRTLERMLENFWISFWIFISSMKRLYPGTV